MKPAPQDILALSVTLALHILVAGLLWFGMPAFLPPQQAKVVPVQAVFLDSSRSLLAQQRAAEARRQAELEEARQRAEQERRRKAEEEARRQAEALAKKKAAELAREQAAEKARQEKAAEEARLRAEAEAKRKAAEQAARQAEAEAKRKAQAEAKRKAAEEAARKQRQKENEQRFKEALAAEEAALQAQAEAAAQALQDQSDRAEYQRRLFEHIQANWSRPPGTDEDFSCQIRIRQLPGGQIQSHELLESCGNPFLDASVENAIQKSDPLPLPQNPRVFDRTLTLIFQP